MKTKHIFMRYHRFFLVAFFLVCVSGFSAHALEFITEEDFSAEKSVYKDFPLKILFKKLQESDAAAKREIRNMIILKQVFDRKIQEKEKVGVLKYDKIFGVIKEITEDDFKLWIPETDTYQRFYVGIDRLPVENNNNYQLTASNIGSYALSAYVMDGRIYKLEIDYLLAVPGRLSVKREGSENLLGWDIPETREKPVGYKVFINEKPFATVENTLARVPRTEGKIDTYYIKAVYRHGQSYIDSDASVTVKDEIAANEIEQKALANRTYDRIIPLLNSDEWAGGKEVLYENRQLLVDNLEGARKTNVKGLVDFFKDIDTGDQFAGLTPATLENLEKASALYQQAEAKANALPAEIGVLLIARSKIDENSSRKLPMLAEKNSQKQAEDTYNRIVARLTPLEWETAKTLLYENQPFLTDYLEDAKKLNAVNFIEFFRDIDGGDRLSAEQPETLRNLESALMFYRHADQKTKEFPGGVDMSFLSQLRMNQTADRIDRLESQSQAVVAVESAPVEPQAVSTSPKPDPDTLDGKTAHRWGIKEFKSKNYLSSLHYFERVYGSQIQGIKHGNQLAGLLSLPENLRPLIIFLIEYEDALPKTGNDSSATIDDILQHIENGTGLWRGIPEAKRNMIIKYIAE